MTPKAKLVERLRALCRNHGVDAVAEEVGVSAENLRQILAARKLPSGEPRGVGPTLQAKLTKQYRGWDEPETIDETHGAFLGAEEAAQRDRLFNAPARYVRLPLLAEASAGPGRVPIDTDGEVVPHVEVLESWIREKLKANPKRLYVLTVRGNSMRGVVEDGDILFVEPCTVFKPDGLYVLTLGDLLRVKRLSVRIDGLLSIESTDGRAPEVVPMNSVGSMVHIQGRVVGAWGLREV